MSSGTVSPFPGAGPAAHREPPYNLEAEQALLGAILLNNRAYERVADTLRPEHFADPVNGRIFEACGRLIDRGQVASPVTLKGMFDQDAALAEIGGAAYLVKLAASVVTVINAADYGREIRDTALRRRLIQVGEDMVNAAFDRSGDTTAPQLVEHYTSELALVPGAEETGGLSPARDGVAVAMRSIEEAQRRGSRLIGLSTGLVDLDAACAGMVPTDLILAAGRPSMGKSALARTIAGSVARAGHGVALFSPEMSEEQQHQGLIAARTGIAATRLRSGAGIGEQEWHQISSAGAEIGGWPLYIDDRSGLTLGRLRSSVRRLLARGAALGLIVVDYLGYMRPEGRHQSRVGEISEISAGLKAIAKDFKVPVLALSQLSRQVEQRDDKRPMLSDLRDSGSLEQDADMVWFVYREAYYLEKSEPVQRADERDDAFTERRSRWDDRLAACAHTAEVIVAKNRMGPTGICRLHFDGPTLRFANLARQHYDDEGGF